MPEKKLLTRNFTKEDSVFKTFPASPILWSKKIASDGLRLEHHLHPAHGTSECCKSHYTISIHFGSPIQLEQVANGRIARGYMSYGDIIVSPPNLDRKLRWDREAELLILNLEPIFFGSAVYESVDADNIEVIPQFQLQDPLIQHLGLALKKELELDELGSDLYAESMVTALSVHLMRRYSTRKQTIREYTDGLPKYKLQQVIEYVNANLVENLSLKAMSEQVCMSQYHFARLFKQSTNFSPYQYVIKCRIERAKQLLKQGKFSIPEIALLVGFADQSQFTRHFKRLMGVTPKQICKK